MQGHKRGARFSNDFKAKVLARHVAGETAMAIAKDLKISDKSISNWLVLYKAGKMDLQGNSITPEGEPRTRGTRYGAKRAPYKPHKRDKKKRAAAEAATPARTKATTTGLPRNVQALQIQVTRLEKELAYIKADRDVLVTALAQLTK